MSLCETGQEQYMRPGLWEGSVGPSAQSPHLRLSSGSQSMAGVPSGHPFPGSAAAHQTHGTFGWIYGSQPHLSLQPPVGHLQTAGEAGHGDRQGGGGPSPAAQALTLLHTHHLLGVFSHPVTTGTFCISFQGG